jgi:hypothetical protein
MFTKLHRTLGLLRTTPPPSWRLIKAFAIGGLTEAGFAGGTDLLLVLSHEGRGVFDCIAGTRIARDDDPDFWDIGSDMMCEGLGPLDGQGIRVAGLRGGALPAETRDGWKITHINAGKRNESLRLTAPNAKPTEITNICEFRTFGFSPTEKTLVIASSCDLTIYSRA